MPILSAAGGPQIIRRRTVAAAVWYRAGGAPAPVAAYQPKGAASLVASYTNLANPGTLNLAGAIPTWDATIGYTSYVVFSEATYLNGGPFTAFWRGKIAAADYTLSHCLTRADGTNWTSFKMHGGSPLVLYCGANSTFTPRFSISATAGTDYVVAYQKLADNSQRMWLNGTEVTGSPKAGTAYTANTFALATGGAGAFAAFAVYHAVLTDGQVAAVTTAMAAL